MSESNILQLSPEILTKIFQTLDLPDRKCVRLSCKSFYDACNQMSIISQEKFVFRRGNCIQEITKTLLSCQYLRLNLEFQALPMHVFPRKLWTHCGERIYSLTFYQSSVKDEVMKNIVIQCRNLKHWKVWVNKQLCRSSKPVYTVESSKPFEELVKQRIIRKKLETFGMYVNNKLDNWASIIEKIFTIFPNLKTFEASNWCPRRKLNNSSALTSIDKCLKSTNIERLVLNILSDGHWLKNSSVWDLGLKEIRISIYHTDQILEMLLNFFSRQKLLEVVCLSSDVTEESIKKLMFNIIRNCPNLKDLRLDYPFTITLNQSEFCLLLQKHLEFLKLRFNVNISQPDEIATTIQLPINRDLHTLVMNPLHLHVNHYFPIDKGLILIMEYFQNLKHLELIDITDAVLQAIIKNQVNLEILLLYFLGCTDFGFTGRRVNEDPAQPGYSIKRLKNLQCLRIFGGSKGLSEVTFLEFQFPKLKHFRFGLTVKHSEILAKSFMKIAEHAPLLEMFFLHASILDFNQLLDFCCKLKKLYYIDCNGAQIHDLDCIKLFSSCSSLRFVADDYDTIFYPNPLTKRISSQLEYNLYFNHKCLTEFPTFLSRYA